MHAPGARQRILILSDLHLYAASGRALRGVDVDHSLASVLDATDGHGPFDVVVLTGDLAQEETEATYARLRAALEPLEIPVLSLPGNHDDPQLMQRCLIGDGFSYDQPLTLDNWCLMPLDSHETGRVGGRLGGQQLERLEKTLHDPQPDHFALFLHHHPLPCGSRWLDTIGLADAAEFFSVIDDCDRVRCVYYGHIHQRREACRNGVTIAATPSTCRQFLPDSEEFKLDDRTPAWRILILHADGSFDSDVHHLPTNWNLGA